MSGAPRLPDMGRNLVNQGKAKGANSGLQYPSEIKCYACKRSKPHTGYSKRQLQQWRSTIYQPYAPLGRVTKESKATCIHCTQKQTTELTCCVCGETKGTDRFAKAQRKDPDRARCIPCVSFHVDADPDLELKDIDEYAESEPEDDTDFDTGRSLGEFPRNPPAHKTSGSSVDDPVNEMNPWDTESRTSAATSAAYTQSMASNRPQTQTQPPAVRSYASSVQSNSMQSSLAATSCNPKKENVTRGGWARPEKIKKVNNNSMDTDDAESTISGTSERGDKRYDTGQGSYVDPWDAIYK